MLPYFSETPMWAQTAAFTLFFQYAPQMAKRGRRFVDQNTIHYYNRKWFEQNWSTERLKQEVNQIEMLNLATIERLFNRYVEEYRANSRNSPTDHLMTDLRRIDNDLMDDKEGRMAELVRDFIEVHQERGFCWYLVQNIRSLQRESTTLSRNNPSGTAAQPRP